jgi:hypothetical protein
MTKLFVLFLAVLTILTCFKRSKFSGKKAIKKTPERVSFYTQNDAELKHSA